MSKCLLCIQPSEPLASWAREWDRKCTESICKLLTLDLKDFLVFFENVAYCGPCHEFIRDIDFTMRTMALLEEKALESRTILSQKLLPHFERWCSSEQQQEDEGLSSSPICSGVSDSALKLRPEKRTNIFTRIASKTGDDSLRSQPISAKETTAPDNLTNNSELASVTDESRSEMNEIFTSIELKDEHEHSDSFSDNQSQVLDNQCGEGTVPERSEERTRIRCPEIVTVLDLKEEEDCSGLNVSGTILNNESSTITIQSILATAEPLPLAAHASSVLLSRRSLRIRNKPVTYPVDEDSEPEAVSDDAESDFAPGDEEDSDIDDDVAPVPIRRNENDSVAAIVLNIRNSDEPETISERSRRTLVSGIRKRIRSSRKTSLPSRIRPNRVHQTAFRKRLTFRRKIMKTKYICGINGCDFEAVSPDWLDVHKIEHQVATAEPVSESTFLCTVCNLNFSPLSTHELHMDRAHRPTTLDLPSHIQCPGCSRKFGKGKVLRREFREFQKHFNAIHVPRPLATDTRRFPFLCPIRDCRSRCRTLHHLEIHTRKCHERDPKPYKCDICRKAFTAATLLVSHKNRKHNGPVGVCHVCGKGFPTKLVLNDHISHKHPQADKFLCKVCEATFCFSADCETHEKIHKPESLNCILGSCYYKLHKSKWKAFDTVEQLRTHVQEVHPYEKLFKCESCTYTCHTKPLLIRHQLKHTKEKPFLCKSCPKTFKSKLQVDAHEENKHPDPNHARVYRCKLCPDTFHSRQWFARHTFWHKHGSTTGKPNPNKSSIQAQGDGVPGKRKINRKKPVPNDASVCNQVQDKSTTVPAKKRRVAARKRRTVISDSENTGSDSEVYQPTQTSMIVAESGTEPDSVVPCVEDSQSTNDTNKLQTSNPNPRYLRLRERPRKKVYLDL